MGLLFQTPSWVLSALFVAISSIVASLMALCIIRKCISAEKLRAHHDVAGFTFSIIGVLYSVLLGFIVINVQSRYSQTEETIHTEAMMLSDLYRNADYLPTRNQIPIRISLREYVNSVINIEWNLPPNLNTSLRSQKILYQLWNSYYNVDMSTEKEKIWYEQSISKLDQLMNARLNRVFSAWERLRGMMWTLLIVGAVITIGFMFFFGLENVRSQMLMTALLAGYLSFMLFLVYSMDHIFGGPEGIKPIAFQEVLHFFNEWDGAKK